MKYPASSFAFVCYTTLWASSSGFQLPTTQLGSNSRSRSFQKQQPVPWVGHEEILSGQPRFLFGRNKEEANEETSGTEDSKDEKSSRRGGFLPFFAKKEEKEQVEPVPTTATATTEPPTPTQSKTPDADDPISKAQALRAQAERARLEAERMDAELTLRKITRLEKEMTKAAAKEETDEIERLQREMDILQAKIRGETPPPVVVAPPPKKKSSEPKFELTISTNDGKTIISPDRSSTSIQMPILKQISQDDLETVAESLEKSPNFIKKLLAQMVEVDFVSADDIDLTEVTKRMVQMQNFDFSYSSRPKPSFTQAEIDAAIDQKLIRKSNVDLDKLPEVVKGNQTAEALLALEYNYYANAYDESSVEQLLVGEDWLQEVIAAVNKSDVDTFIENFYPKCTRKDTSPPPTLAQVKQFMADVLPKASFTPRGEPEQVLGGYVVRGTSKSKTGDETIAAIDKQLEKFPNIKDKMTVLYTKDFTLLADLEAMMDWDAELPNYDEQPPILYITGPDIVPERKRVALSVTTAFGIATSWYLSVYPFLLNPAVLKRVEEQLDLADASMAYDLSWLSELSLPLFLTFIGIQLAHEAGHKLAGALYGVPTTFPTFVPSIITGVTSTVTQFKEPPTNQEALFDISIAGPLVGSLASLAALVIGSQLTLVTDPNVLPALPLDILRQSTLGGGIIDAILGGGALNVPLGAEASQAVAGMTVSLHPVAIAGYIGLILNGLALLPIGTTDGGRIAQALFGRTVKKVIGQIFLLTVFLVGVLGSDLFLFYFSFLIAFQTGTELPARNEVDNISFSRVLVATAATVLALLTLIPFQ